MNSKDPLTKRATFKLPAGVMNAFRRGLLRVHDETVAEQNFISVTRKWRSCSRFAGHIAGHCVRRVTKRRISCVLPDIYIGQYDRCENAAGSVAFELFVSPAKGKGFKRPSPDTMSGFEWLGHTILVIPTKIPTWCRDNSSEWPLKRYPDINRDIR